MSTRMVERNIPSHEVQVVLSRHAAFLAGRPGGTRLQSPGVHYENLRLDGAKLDDAILSRAGFGNASLTNAELRRADLFCADFQDADLTRVVLDRADLRGADRPPAHVRQRGRLLRF